MIKYVLFDFDGVIADTEDMNFTYLRRALEHFDITLTEEDEQSFIGANGRIRLAQVLPDYREGVTVDEIMAYKTSLGSTYADQPLEPMPGLIDFLKSLRDAGISTAVVSSSSTKSIVTALNRMRMIPLFDLIVGGDMCPVSKPDPAIYRKAMALFGADPEACLVFEDSPNGIQAGKAAGAVVAAYRGTGIVQDTAKADLLVDSYCGLRIEQLN